VPPRKVSRRRHYRRDVRIVADVNERQSGIPKALEGFGLDLERRALPAGDYALGPDVLIERKSVLDLHASIIQGRAVIHQGIRLLRTSDRDDSALWLERLAARAVRFKPIDRPRYARRPHTSDTAEAMLAAVGGISTTGARALLRHFGSVANVGTAGETEWREVPGIGPKRARALAEALGQKGPS
jgi:ERCC4-type nuclease